jgi:serine/tyrosine/threonine adenylyltransferase
MPLEPANDWQSNWHQRLSRDGVSRDVQRQTMARTNPIYIARNHQIEQAIEAANSGDFSPFHRLVQVIAQPFTKTPEHQEYAAVPNAEQEVLATYCGT